MIVSVLLKDYAVDIAKKFVIEQGKKLIYKFIDAQTGKSQSEIIAYRSTPNSNSVLLLIHGFSGSASETFGSTPDLLVKNPAFNGWDILSIGYSSDMLPSIGKGLWSVNPDIDKIASYLQTLLQNQFQGYKRVALAAHSMGGLVAQRTVLNLNTAERARISHFICFGTPSNGLKKASWFKFWNTQIKDLGENSKFIKDLRAEWKASFNTETSFVFKTVAGSKDEFVPTSSSLGPFDEQYHAIIEGNHLTMVKPKDDKDEMHQSYQIILKVLTNQNIDYLHQGDNLEELNLLLGNYQEIIGRYEKNALQLAQREFIMLIFALECTGRKVEALALLSKHPDLNNNSDLLGIIGGRFKRKYLVSGLKRDFNSAEDNYKKGLDLASKLNDAHQMYYHAINLAFLYALNGEIDQRKCFAKQALENCDKNSKILWEIATIAEANLYLENFDLALTWYEKAAKLANLREKMSIYTNAFEGYKATIGSANDNLDFLTHLGVLFL